MRRNKRQSEEGQAQRTSLVTPGHSRPDGAPKLQASSNHPCLLSDDATASSCDVAISAAADAFNQQDAFCQEYGRAADRGSRFAADECDDLLHQLSNVLTSVIMNAQMLEWKLPAYSHLKRPLHELERNAQRGGELVKQLRQRVGEGKSDQARIGNADSQVMVSTVVAMQEPGGRAVEADSRLTGIASGPAPGFFVNRLRHLTTDCDPCTSSFFPKRDDGSGR
jgi:hypothetical protein